jgi:hypothetical protein
LYAVAENVSAAVEERQRRHRWFDGAGPDGKTTW